MEEEGSISYWSVLFKANDFIDLLDRLNMIQEIAAADRHRIEELDETAKLVEETRVTLQREQAELRNRRQQMAAKQEELNRMVQESENLLSQLIAKGEEYEKWIAEQEDKLSDLEDELINKEAEYDKKKFEEWLATSVPPTTVPQTTGPSSSGGITSGPVESMTSTTIWRSGKAMTPNTVDGVTWYTPCDYNRISSTFGMRLHPIDGYVKPHKGVDFAIGHTPIYATRAGVVTVATTWEDASAGYYVVIDHGDGFRSIYMHMCTRPYVKVGDFVQAGQEIGCVGSTGASTGNHLHFGISQWDNKTKKYVYVNPLLYVK
jgi:murein DD-endopeptidase MepM/ murein hydrolase activator NlpD